MTHGSCQKDDTIAQNGRKQEDQCATQRRAQEHKARRAQTLVAARDKRKQRTRPQAGVFTLSDPKKIAASLKRSAEHSARRKTGAYRSALSMLTFYINRAGKTLPKTQRARLEKAKVELKRAFGKE